MFVILCHHNNDVINFLIKLNKQEYRKTLKVNLNKRESTKIKQRKNKKVIQSTVFISKLDSYFEKNKELQPSTGSLSLFTCD